MAGQGGLALPGYAAFIILFILFCGEGTNIPLPPLHPIEIVRCREGRSWEEDS